MIKLIWLLARKQGVTIAEFQSIWRREHAEIVLASPGIRAYIQSHVVPAGYAHYEPPWDGMAELWFDDLDALAAAEASGAWKQSGAHSAGFIARGARLVTTEAKLLDGFPTPQERASMVKCVCLPNRKQGLSVAEFQQRWRERHAPLVMAAFPRMQRYVQCHVLPETYESDRPPRYDGVVELWCPSLEGFSWGLILRGDEPVREPSSGNPAATDAHALFELPTPGLPMREVAFEV